MSTTLDIVGDTGLKFFGKISASISHELKNSLSIINESAGLLEDLTLMAQKGKPLDPDRVEKTARMIKQQVNRSDDILKAMNRFSHSIDRPSATIDVYELFPSLMTLTRRITETKGIHVTYEVGDAPMMLTISPFFLKTLLWHLLDFAMELVGDSKKITLVAEKSAAAIVIRFLNLNAPSDVTAAGFPGSVTAALMNMLSANVSFETGSMLLTLPLEAA